ncbi:MAG: glycoside hydrolase family 43 protein [Phycisphaerae bacterium]|jgi:xylan 1,4-beta-xylosidase
MATIRNPILPGFNPDPSICRVGEDYYIATSTFEWFPGVQIHHSRDLVHWRLITHPLDRLSQLDMTGNACSSGIWAPCLTYSDGLFWLLYTDVKCCEGAFKDTPNYLVTAPSITGPWSEPIYLNASGFDPSLLHDDDGRKWLVNQLWEFRKDRNRFAGVVLQEYSVAQRRLVGPVKNIFLGSALGTTEGPHLYKINGWYYLMTAEGGTGYGHAVTLARSRQLEGPYEVGPRNPVLTSRDCPDAVLLRAGHGSIVQAGDGQWYMAHLCSRPVLVGDKPRCILGRETAIQKVRWTADGWLELADGGKSPKVEVEGPNLKEHPWPAEPTLDDFDGPKLSVHFATLRLPAEESWLSLRQRPGWMRLFGRQSLTSRHRQSLVARRVQSLHCQATTCVEFDPEHFQQMAGLVGIYNVRVWHYLAVTRDEKAGKCLHLFSCDNGKFEQVLDTPISIEGWERVFLRARIEESKLTFFYAGGALPPGDKESALDKLDWKPIAPALDASRLSDDYVQGPSFTGAFLGLCCQDLSGMQKPADFDFFQYKEM